MLTNQKFIIGISSGARYGSFIDKVIGQHNDQDNLVFRSAADHYMGLNSMLAKGNRIDAFIGLPIENNFNNISNNQFSSQLLSYSIEGDDSFIFGYIGCAKSEFGKHVIKKINEIILKERTNKIKDYYQKWLFKEEIPLHQNLVDKYFN